VQKEQELNEVVESLNMAIAAEREKRKEVEKKHEDDIVKMQMEVFLKIGKSF